MKRELLFAPLIILIMASVSIAGMGMSGSVTSRKPDGERLKIEIYGDIIASPDHIMSNARNRGKGRHFHRSADGSLEVRSAAQIAVITDSSIELNLKNGLKSFLITTETSFCDENGTELKPKKFKSEDMVTVLSGVDEKTALSIRIGPIFFTGVMAGAAKLSAIDCK